MKRIGALLAVMTAALMLACGAVMAATSTQNPPEQARFRVTLNGFSVNQETWDHALEVDGKGDEVYVRYDTRLVNDEATTLAASSDQSKVMGDTNGFSDRVKAGSRSSLGGLKTGDAFPSSTPWIRSGDIMSDRPPMKLFEGNLIKGETGAAITPTIWEWDGGKDLFNTWGQSIVTNGPKLAQAVAGFINGSSGNGEFIKNNTELGLSSLFALARDILGQAQDRPVGWAASDANYDFSAKTLMLTYENALQISQTDFGKGPGVLAINYQDPANIGGGQYTVYLQVERVDTPPAVTAPRPAPSSQIKDRTPLIGATVRDAQTDLAQGNINLYVDGRAKSFSYNAATDRLTYQSGRLAYGGHTVKVEATDASGLKAAKTWRFKVVRS
jgi:hypothetical protein